MKTKLKYIKQLYPILLFVLFVNFANAQNSDSFSILLTGNTSENYPDEELFEKWKQLSHESENMAFLMLGNIYNPGENKYSEKLFLGNKIPLLLAPGEKEWANGGSSGKKIIKEIGDRLNEHYDGSVYLPDAACPGPVEIVLNDNLVVILIDTHWWVHKYDRRFNKCGLETSGDVLVHIEDAIRRHYQTKHVVVAGHHSIKSYGNSGGYFSFAQRIFEAPYTFYRKIPGTRKDNQHPDFKGFRDAMLSVLKKYPDIIYASSGGANLQYFQFDNAHHVISGSMVQSEFVRSKQTEFGSTKNGFARLNFSSKGDCELNFIGVNGELFRKTIYKKTFVSSAEQEHIIEQLPDSMTIKASNKYNIPESGYFWLGENYRAIWDTPVKVPVFDIGAKKEGLKIIKRGGGQQTLSLRLEDKDGRQFVLRSVDKNVKGVLPDELKNMFAVDVVQDQISASNPFAALVVAELAELAGVFHTNPEIVYVPDDPRFGIYRQDVAGQLFIFEERPDGDRSDVASFGYSKDVISTDETIEKIFDDEDHFINSEATLRARLFDILINDWDRHDDQWRWAGFENGDKTNYKPIPRDRDQAFFVNEGVIPGIAKQKALVPKIQGFDEYTENIIGHSFNARYFDRTFLTQSNWEDWRQQIDFLKTVLTSEQIDKAVLSFPKEVQHLCARETAEILKARLDNLEPMARKLYLSLAKEVDITGTNKCDWFEITVPNDTTIQITGFHIKKNDEKGSEIYSRIFYASETNKIRIYGFDKKDRFVITGHYKSKIDLKIIGGDKDDEVIYEESKAPRYISIYDKKSTDLSPSLKKQIKNIYNLDEIKYDREAFKNDVFLPALFLGYNQDDGVFTGAGVNINKFSRYNSQNFKFLANYANLTKAFNFHFSGKNSYPLKRLELGFDAYYKSPGYVNNFFGFGNETNWQEEHPEKEYYRIRMNEYFVKTDFVKLLDKENIHKAGLGVFFKNTEVETTPDRFISDLETNGLDPEELQPHSFAGVSFKYELNTMSNGEGKKEVEFFGSNMFPSRGTKVNTEISHFVGLNNDSPHFTKMTGEASTYLSFSKRPRVVYAVRLGGEKLFGDYVFTEAAKLGQKENLRAYRQTRFYGDASLYLNTEMRIRMKQFNTYVLNGTIGLMLFNDIGRVWYESEKSSRWHDGYGMGFWFSPFDLAVFTISYAGSKEDDLINVTVNYQF